MKSFITRLISIVLIFSMSYSYSITNPYIIDSEVEVDDREASYVAWVASFCITALYGLLLNKCSEKAMEKGLDKAKREIIAQIQDFHSYRCNRYIHISAQSANPSCYSSPRGSHRCIINDTHYGYSGNALDYRSLRKVPVKMCYYLKQDTSNESEYMVADMYRRFEQQECSNQLVTTTYYWTSAPASLGYRTSCHCYGVNYRCGDVRVEIKKNF